MAQPKVSILVPVYNVEKFIARCLDSLLNQTYKNIEVILVNDCTPDGSWEIAKEYTKKDKRIKLIEHEKNFGPMRARDNALKVASGNYIAYCDSDDTMPLDAIEKLAAKAEESGADVVSGDITYVATNGEERLWRPQELKYGEYPVAVYKSLLLGEYAHNLNNKLFKAEALKNYEYDTFDDCTNGEDAYLFYQVVQNTKKIVHINEEVYHYRQNTESSTQRRLTEKGIRSLLLLLLLRKKISKSYPQIEILFSRRITSTIVEKYRAGYAKEYPLDKIIAEYDGLSEYAETRYMFRKYDFTTFLKFWTKKNICPIIGK